MIYADPHASDETLFLRVMLFKIFNKIETWQALVDELGLPEASNFDFARCSRYLSLLRARGASIYSGAYIMPSGGKAGGVKHEMHLALIQKMLKDKLPRKLSMSSSLKGMYELLLEVPTFGAFLAFQCTSDINYSPITDDDESEFVVPGPGALDGVAKCFGVSSALDCTRIIMWLAENQRQEMNRYCDTEFENLWGRSLMPIDIQNLFCEVSKYTRVSHPDAKGVSGRTRIKQSFKPTGQLPKPFFPPKWKLNYAIDLWAQEKSVKCTLPLKTVKSAQCTLNFDFESPVQHNLSYV